MISILKYITKFVVVLFEMKKNNVSTGPVTFREIGGDVKKRLSQKSSVELCGNSVISV